MADSPGDAATSGKQAPHPGSPDMPRWQLGELIEAPMFTWRNWFALLGPGLVLGGSAIGGGEWLTGPAVTARYGGALMWLATLSIVGQVIYNIEISRYTLYCGEPIFTGKFRTFPGPRFWLLAYLLLDFGAFIPYLAANAGTTLAFLLLGHLPETGDTWLMRLCAYLVFFVAMTPLVFGGKIYNTLKAVMTTKIVLLLGFLLFLAVFHSSWQTWRDIGWGFLRFGTVPIERGEDANGNGVLDPGEDWDGDGRLDGVEPKLAKPLDSDGDGKNDTFFLDQDGDGIRDGDNVDNVFLSILQGRGLPTVDLGMIAILATFAAIAGNGGLSNAPLSNYTRDQGWGMGYHVGAIPSVVGAHHLQLSHVGMVFEVTPESLPRWRRWLRHLVRDQVAVWMPACFLGMALPSMLSVQFLPRGTLTDDWTISGMTAKGVQDHVAGVWGSSWGTTCWYITILCGFMALGPSVSSQADGVIRRWVDVIWTSSGRLREWHPRQIRYLYFGVLVGFMCLALTFLTWGLFGGSPTKLLKVAGNFNNMGLGFSCFHALAVNCLLLPKPIRPHWLIRVGLFLTGVFFTALFIVTTIRMVTDFKNF